MKTTRKLMLVALLLASSTTVHAAGGSGTEMGLGAFIFLGFLALVLVLQMIPGLILFFSMLKGLFSPVSGKESTQLAGNKSDKAL